jgi:hypothetical protein
MKNEYTRQRQGRDFPIHSTQANVTTNAGGDLSTIDSIISSIRQKDDNGKMKSLLSQLEQCKTEADRNAVPVDGHEPPERGR